MAGRSAADLSSAIQRIMACNSAALATENRRKLQVGAAFGCPKHDELSYCSSGGPMLSSVALVVCVQMVRPQARAVLSVRWCFALQTQYHISLTLPPAV